MEFESKGLISLEINGEVYGYRLYESLDSLSKTKSQRRSAKELNISHTVFNRRILKAEEKLGFKLTKKVGNGTALTQEGLDLLEEFKKYAIQIEKTSTINIVGGHISTGLLESIDLPFKTNIYSSNDEDAFELAKRGVVDLLTLDDPLIAFERDINFYPIAYDYLVLVSSPNSKKIETISDLENLDFVSVSGSAQRLAWDSLRHYDIHVNIKESVSSQFDAYKLVRDSKNLHTFLNASYFKGNELLKFDTQHVISLVKVNEDKTEVNDFIKYLTNEEGQKTIEKQGFTPM
ncbi:LysR family transcriptional regulator [uncultured Methanobrevibacter sp.]|uniref:LysR family transcriptional regulator n=2 Tax=uncultured Methanobrevibacter sp. TaxID=253161 RepID=UPI002600AB82|nr:LysR family transcriptional regulator [uncultured Methanobrevibacter sp.]MCI6994569.1 LysR family transcriptional regulator [Methanobrevibacter sp.]